jgi:hypothetical protein
MNTLSTYVGSQPQTEKCRFFKRENTHKMIPFPKAVTTYNNYMGGVDLLDSMLGYYRQGRPLGGASGAFAPGADFEGAPKRRSPTAYTLILSTVT